MWCGDGKFCIYPHQICSVYFVVVICSTYAAFWSKGLTRCLARKFPKASLQAAIAQSKEITPLLLNILHETIENYQLLAEEEMGHIYAMFLLAQFREKSAFPVIMQLANLIKDENMVGSNFGYMIVDSLHKMIASVYDGDLSAIKRLIENSSLCIWVRNAGVYALLVLVKAGVLERQVVMAYCKDLFYHPAFINDERVLTELICAVCDLYPAEVYCEIKAAFDDGRVDTDVIDMQFVEDTLVLGEDKELKENLGREYDLIFDVIKELQGWACFEEMDIRLLKNVFARVDLKQTFDYLYMTLMKSDEIDRNEYCSCGSGKRYKKCCFILH